MNTNPQVKEGYINGGIYYLPKNIFDSYKEKYSHQLYLSDF